MTIRIGLLGASRIAPRAVIEPARERTDVILAKVAARDPERAESYAAEHGVAGASPSYADLVADPEIDLIYNGLPASGHAEWTLRALEAGKAVLCEKPFCIDAAEARRMVDAARAAGRPLIEAYHYRFHSVIRRAELLLAEGAIGPVRRASAWFNVPIARSDTELRWIRALGGGGLMDLGCYPLHALRTLLRVEPTVRSAEAEFENGVDARLSARLAFGTVDAEIACSMVAERPEATLRLEGERGALEIVNFVAPQVGCRFTLTRDGQAQDLDVSGPTTYAAQLDHVVEVMAGRAEPLTGGQDAIRQMEAIDAIYAAADRPPA